MTQKLENLLKQATNEKSKNNKNIAQALMKNPDLNRITKIADFCQVSLSSVDRFIKKLGYPSFKHFLYEFENEEDFSSDKLNDFSSRYKEEVKKISQKIVGKLFIATSRKDKCIGKFLNERLNDGKIENSYFHESTNSIEEFIQRSVDEKGTLMLISFFNYSRIFNHFLKFIAQRKQKPNVIIITNAKWIDVFDKYDYISIGQIGQKNYDIEKFDEYNYFLSDVFILFFELLSEIWEKNNSKVLAV